MKKIICILLAMVILYSNTALADNFTIHNGVSFGMTVDEVKATESNGGLQFQEVTKWNNFFDNDIFRLESEYTTVAGRDESQVAYLFDTNGRMNAVLYIADDWFKDSFNNDGVIEALEGKYGEPVAKNDEIVDIGGEAYDSVDVYINYMKQHPSDNPKVTLFYQWLYPLDEGYVDIQVEMISLSVINYRIISYSYRTEEEIDAVRDKIQKEKQSIENDL